MGRRLSRALVPVVSSLIGLSACGSDTRTGDLAIPVDLTIAPAQAEIGGRPVGRMVSASGIETDFFLGELLVATDDPSKVEAFAARWGGRVLESSPGDSDEAPGIYRMAIDPSSAVVASLLADLNGKSGDLTGRFRVSSDDAAKLLAVALSEVSALGMNVMPNFVLQPHAIIDGATSEAPTGDGPLYSQNPFEWPYMNRGSAQDIGVGAALQAMARAGVFGNKVRIMILDGGFAPNADFPVDRRVAGAWNERNAGTCGGNPCPWHGTGVTTAAMGAFDGSYGAAGPAAPVAQLVAVPMLGGVFDMIENVRRVARGLDGADIVNISAGFELDVGWDVATKMLCLGACPSPTEIGHAVMAGLSATNKLIFASAGNSGKDIDGRSTPEGSTTMPCELATVVCVGGMAHDATALFLDDRGGSNFGTRTDDDSVDIYGPFWTWIGPDPDNVDNHARLRSGTSYSSPFVAGVAALVWASKPSLSARQVWEIVRDTAHVGGVHDGGGHQRRVNAYRAVERALSGAAPTITLTTTGPVAQLNRVWSATAAVQDDGRVCSPLSCPLTWSPPPERVSGNTAFFRFLRPSVTTVSVTATDPFGQVTTASIDVNAVDDPPVVSISAPTPGATFPQGVPVQLLASATDANSGPGPGPGQIPCSWTSSVVSDSLALTGCDVVHTFTSQGPRTLTVRATDALGATVSRDVSITVAAPPVNFPPTVTNTTSLPPVNYDARGYVWGTSLPLSASATDPEGDTPITYAWRATSYRPKSTTVYASNVLLGSSASVAWTPSSTPSLFGDFAAFGNDCYDGQLVRVSVVATDGLGNSSAPVTLPDVRVFRCTLD